MLNCALKTLDNQNFVATDLTTRSINSFCLRLGQEEIVPIYSNLGFSFVAGLNYPFKKY